MSKNLALVSYGDTPRDDGKVVMSDLQKAGFSVKPIHQWTMNPQNSKYVDASFWKKFDGIVLEPLFYANWSITEMLKADKPILSLNSGYIDEMEVGASSSDSKNESRFKVTDNTHPVTSGLALEAFDASSSLWYQAVEVGKNPVQVLATTMTGKPLLTVHKNKRRAYFGWYRMVQAHTNSVLHSLLVSTACWTFT